MIEKDLYLLKLENDPGPETITDFAKSAPFFLSIQPNYIYRALPRNRMNNEKLNGSTKPNEPR